MDEASACQRAELTALWLAGGKGIDRLSMLLTLLALAVACTGGRDVPVQLALLSAALLGAVEKLYAVRVAFDRRVFASWGAHWRGMEPCDPQPLLAEFDQALVSMRLRSAAQRASRPLDERLAGACALFRKQAICLGAQFCAVLTAACVHLIRPDWPFRHGF